MSMLRINCCGDPPPVEEGMAIDFARDAAMIFGDGTASLARSCRTAAFLGIRNIFLVPTEEAAFTGIREQCGKLAREYGFPVVEAFPAAEFEANAVCGRLRKMVVSAPFRMPVESKNEKGYRGQIASGTVKPGDRIRAGGIESRVGSVESKDGVVDEASMGDTVTIRLEEEADLGKGDVISSALDPVELSDQFEAKVLCTSGHLVSGRPYVLRMHTLEAGVTITMIKHSVEAGTGKHLAARKLEANEIGTVNISTSRPVPFESFEKNRILGSFILLDRNETVGAGRIDFALRRASNIHWQSLAVDRAARAAIKHQKPRCLWLTGLSGSGKSTIANLLEKRLFSMGRHTYILDGDNVRHGLNRDLGFTEADRVENIRRVSEVSRLMVDAGLVVIVSFLSPFRSERAFARSLFNDGEFVEIFVDAPFAECEKRDTKGLYAKARRGELKNFTGLDSPYEPPESPEIRLDTVSMTPEECVVRVLGFLGGTHV